MNESQVESACIGKESCPSCGSRDNLGRYDDGHGYCFGCKHYEPPLDGAINIPTQRKPPVSADFLLTEFRPLSSRKITEETCRKYSYGIGQTSSGKVQVAPYFDASGAMISQHIRTNPKDFFTVGQGKDLPLFGQNLCPPTGKRVVVTEGEIDCMAVSQAFGNKWPVVSVPNGASGAAKSVARALEFLSGYEKIVVWMDDDEPGRKAAIEVATLLPPGTACIATASGYKDAGEALQAGKVDVVCRAVYDARPYRPGGVVNGEDLWEAVQAVDGAGLAYPWKGLTEMTGGIRFPSLITFTAGTGQGKSTAVAQIAYDLLMAGQTVGYVALEESTGRTAQRFISNHVGRLAHVPDACTPEQLRAGFDATLGTGRLWLLDHFGSTDGENLVSKLRYLAVGCGAKILVLDHISIAISGLGVDGDERRTIDLLMTKLRSLAEETKTAIICVSHLRRVGNDQKSAEDGGQVSLSHLRGSGAIAQLSDTVIATERNQQAEGDDKKNVAFRVLKNRHLGETGVAANGVYNSVSGKIVEANEEDKSEGEF